MEVKFMKKLLTTLLVLSVAGTVMAAPTYTERAVNKAAAPVARKEAAATHKAVKAQQNYQGKKDAAKAIHKQNANAVRDTKNMHKQKVQTKKKQINDLKKY